MRTHALLLRVAVPLLALAAAWGCGRTTDTSAPSTPAQAVAPGGSSQGFKAALVMSGPTTDNGWNAGAFKAWQAVRKALSLSDSDSPYVENATSSGDQEKNLRAYASQGVNVVFGHGNEYEAPALRMESDFPKTMFVISSGQKVGHNTMPIVYKLEDGAYLLGMLAAGMSKSGKLASVGAEAIPPVKSVFAAFAAGARSVKPGITVINPVFTGSWDDPGKAKQATLPLIDQGADVIMQDVDAAAQGVFNAVKERNTASHPVYALGTNSDQNAAAPDVILASAPIDTNKVFVDIATAAKNGTLKANDKPFGMPEGVIGFVINPKLQPRMPADLVKQVDAKQKAITDGSFVVKQGGA